MDLHTARLVAARAGVPHRVAYMGRKDGGGQRYLQRIGFAGGRGKSAKFTGPPMRHLDLTRGWITGHGGGLCIGRYFGRMPAGPLTPSRILKILRIVPQPGFAESIEQWLAAVPDVPPTLALDLMILEHQGGSWIAPHLYGTAPFRMNLLTVAHRDVIDGLFSLPPGYRTSGDLDRDLFGLAWPELLDVPVNEYSGSRRWAFQVRTALASGKARMLGLGRAARVSTPGS